MDKLAEQTKYLTLKSYRVMIIFVVFNMLINTISILPMLLQDASNPDPIKVGYFVIYSYITYSAFIFFVPFFLAGIYGLTFLKINTDRIGINQFLSSAKKNYIAFLIISFVMVLINILYWTLFPRIISLFGTLSDYYVGIHLFGSALLSLLVNLLFVFAYPLVIVGFFSNQNLKPIRSSFMMVSQNFYKIKLIVFLLAFNCAIGLLSNSVLPEAFAYSKKIFMPIITTPITFVVLIYSYLLITECFNQNLQFNFDKAT